MPEIQAGTVRLHCERQGSGDPLLLIMGYGTGAVLWSDAFLEQLARHFELITFDNRGTGRSEKRDEPLEIADLADDAARLVEALGIERLDVVGVSMGGYIAQELVLRHPQSVSRLVLGCTGCGGPGATAAAPEVLALLAPLRGLTPQQAVARTFAAMATPETIASEGPFLEEMTARMLEHATPAFVLRAQMEAIGRWQACDRLGQIASPTLVIHGERDRLVPPKNGAMLASLIPNARLELIPNVAHNFFWEARERTVELITTFLQAR
jgi:3-oxoadipate enol-lactonase